MAFGSMEAGASVWPSAVWRLEPQYGSTSIMAFGSIALAGSMAFGSMEADASVWLCEQYGLRQYSPCGQYGSTSSIALAGSIAFGGMEAGGSLIDKFIAQIYINMQKIS